jgi:hypothetical protein
VQQELIAEIQRTAISPVVVTVDSNINKQKRTEIIDKYGSYVMLIPEGNAESLGVEILGLALGREYKFTRFWISEARFVVAETN